MEEPEVSDGAPEPTPPQLRAFATVFYLAVLIASLGWCYVSTGRWLPDSLTGGDVAGSLGLGAGTAAIVILVSTALVSRVSWMRWFAEEVRRLLGPIDTRTALHLALVSGIAEEVLFRGVMQPIAGYVLTSLVFGLVHIGPSRRYLAWTAFAVAMGFGLGGILQATDSLLGPILAHVGVNFANLRHIGRLNPLP
ncbi:MAG: lysostaphin resistance A-like protein [Planctomycetota bacterium]|jgi:membrane protease YdiL (CAAX protease family)